MLQYCSHNKKRKKHEDWINCNLTRIHNKSSKQPFSLFRWPTLQSYGSVTLWGPWNLTATAVKPHFLFPIFCIKKAGAGPPDLSFSGKKKKIKISKRQNVLELGGRCCYWAPKVQYNDMYYSVMPDAGTGLHFNSVPWVHLLNPGH